MLKPIFTFVPLLAILVLLVLYRNATLELKTFKHNWEYASLARLPKSEQTKLEGLVANQLNASSLANIWDKTLGTETLAISETGNAARGVYYAHDAWDWLAWRQDTSSQWHILISQDAFNCAEVDQIPDTYEYSAFFASKIYMFSLKNRYCSSN